MAIYHLSIKIISRGKGRSAVAAAAYRAGETITNEHDGITHDYTRKSGIAHTEILLPENAPPEFSNRAVLWNAVEKSERYKTAQLAREIELALPTELTKEQNTSLVREYVKQHFVDAGMCADICVHDKKDGNPHAHVMLTMRPIEQGGKWGQKSKTVNGQKIPTVDWNEQTKAEEWRAAWADAVNTVLERQQIDERVDHRSYERQGVEQIPTVHMSVAATQMERKGITTELGNRNREIAHANKILFAILAKLKQLKDWLKEALVPTTPPPFVSLLQSVLEGGQWNQFGQIRDLNAAARVYAFMRENGISQMSELRKTVSEMHKPLDSARDNLRYYEGRTKTLDEHITHGAVYLKHKDLYAEYQQLKPRKQPKFYETNRAELMTFEAAKRYLDDHHIKPSFSIRSWKDEREKLAAERGKVYHEYNALKEKVWGADLVRVDAERIVQELNRPQQQRDHRSRGRER